MIVKNLEIFKSEQWFEEIFYLENENKNENRKVERNICVPRHFVFLYVI